MTDHERIEQRLAARGRRTRIVVSNAGSTITDIGVSGGRFARPTVWTFNSRERLVKVTRPIKAWWLLR